MQALNLAKEEVLGKCFRKSVSRNPEVSLYISTNILTIHAKLIISIYMYLLYKKTQ